MATWDRWPLVLRDLRAAEESLAQGMEAAAGGLTAAEWAVLVWKWTDIPTGLEAWNWDCTKCVGLCTVPLFAKTERGVERVGEAVRYQGVAEIADRGRAWVQAVGAQQMAAWLSLLASERERQVAWNYLHGHYHDFAPGEPPGNATRWRIAQIRQNSGIGRGMPEQGAFLRTPEEEARRAELSAQADEIERRLVECR